MGAMRRPLVRVTSRLFSPEVAAGAFRQRRLADAFAALGCEVEVLTSTPAPGSPAGDDGALRVSRWPALRDDNGVIRGYLPYLSYDLPLAVRTLLRGRPDLYVVEPPPTTGAVMLAVSRLQQVPYVWYAADVWSDAAGSAGAPAPVVAGLRLVERTVLRGAAVVLSVSDAVTDRLVELGVPREQVITVGNGVDTAVFTPEGPRQESDEPYLVYTGTMSEWQGAGVFVEALAEHRRRGGRCRLVFLGQGSELTALKELAARLVPGAVDFPGVVAPEVAARYLRGATAALVSIKPGLGYDFARPTKIYAATATGTPVIFAGAADAAGAELVRSERLGLAAEFTPTAIAVAMDSVTTPFGIPDREHLVTWTRTHASLTARTQDAAVAVIARLRGAGARA